MKTRRTIVLTIAAVQCARELGNKLVARPNGPTANHSLARWAILDPIQGHSILRRKVAKSFDI